MPHLSTSRGAGPMFLNLDDIATARESSRLMRQSSTTSNASQSSTTSASNASWLSASASPSSSSTANTSPSQSPRILPQNPSKTLHLSPVPIILGTVTFGDPRAVQAKVCKPSTAGSIVKKLLSYGHIGIDTARAYPIGRGGTSERLLGQSIPANVKSTMSISSKVTSFIPGCHRAANITRSIDSSLKALDIPQVDIMYLHFPDHATPFDETVRAMDEAYRAGKFLRLGLSNYTCSEVELILLICDRYNYVRPTVYQGMYNPLCRDAEEGSKDSSSYDESLLSLLRKENIAFHAYSPTAAGFFLPTTTPQTSSQSGSRFDAKSPLGAKYQRDYFHDPLFNAAQRVRDVSGTSGISGHVAALRWTVWHSSLDASRGDAVVVGASSVMQMEENLRGVEEGPLPKEVVRCFEDLWEECRGLGVGPKCQIG